MRRVAEQQFGVVTTEQLRAIGVSRQRVGRWVRRGSLVPLHRGVYAVGHTALPRYGREAAAVLAVGGDALLGEESAAMLWDFGPDPLDVTLLSARQRRSRPGIRVRESATIAAADRARRHGLPVTSPVRTLRDLRRHPRFDAYVNDALVARCVTLDPLRRAGVLDEDRPRMTRSAAERRLLELVRRAGLALPLTNHRVLGVEVDAWWPEHRLVVEVDGFAAHATRGRFERDRRNDLARGAAGIRTIRVTWRQLQDEPERVLVALARALAA